MRCWRARRAGRSASRRGWRPSGARARKVRGAGEPPESEPYMRRLLVSLVLAAAVLAAPAASYAANPVPVNLAGVLFNNKKNDKITMKLGSSLRFTWKSGFHNVLTQSPPAGANKVNSGAATATHK